MTQELEWGGVQQLALLLRSSLVGIGMGVLFDLTNGFWRGATKTKRFVVDVILCLLAALITFMCSLVLTDGKLHPVLFIGLLSGMLIEHLSVGRWVGRCVYKCVCSIRNSAGTIGLFISSIFKKVCQWFTKWKVLMKKKPKNVKKTRKKHYFFQKRS